MPRRDVKNIKSEVREKRKWKNFGGNWGSSRKHFYVKDKFAYPLGSLELASGIREGLLHRGLL